GSLRSPAGPRVPGRPGGSTLLVRVSGRGGFAWKQLSYCRLLRKSGSESGSVPLAGGGDKLDDRDGSIPPDAAGGRGGMGGLIPDPGDGDAAADRGRHLGRPEHARVRRAV